MKKLTAKKCKEKIAECQKLKERGYLSISGELNLQAYEIALPVLEQQGKKVRLISTPQHILDAKFKEHFGLGQQGGWISCSERMPKDRQLVLGWKESPGDVIDCYREGIKWYYRYSDGPCGDVTHWQLHPAPPQTSKNHGFATGGYVKEMPKTDEVVAVIQADDGWIDWGGGECPVSQKALVVTKWSDGQIIAQEASEPDWGHDDGPMNIIAYRVVENDGGAK